MFKSYVWLTFCVVVWGSNFVFGKILVQYFSPALVTSLRLCMIVGFLLCLSLFYRYKQKVRYKRDFILLIVLGSVGVFVNQWSFFNGLTTADPTTAALILAMTPIVTGFLAAIFLKEKITIRMLLGSVVALVGIYYVVTNGNLTQIQLDKGLLWIILTMVTFSIMIIITRLLSSRIDPFTVTLYSNIIALFISIPFIFISTNSGSQLLKPTINIWLFLIVTAIIVHGLANLMWNNHIRNVDASKASILTNLEPFVAMIVGFIILAKPITGTELFGALLIVSGVVLSTYQHAHKHKFTVTRK